MQDQPTLSIAEQDRHTDTAVLSLLIIDRPPCPWSVDEVEREIGKDTADSLARLYAAGLVHRLQHFVWPSRAAIVADLLSQ